LKTFRGRILVIRGGAIGDFILTLPAIAALRKQFPEAQLEVLGYPHIAQLAAAAGLVDQVRSIEAGSLAGFFARNGTLAEGLSDYFSDFDLIVSYLYDPDRIFQENVCRCAPAQFIEGPHRPDESDGTHATNVYLRPLERLAIFDADPVPRLAFSGRQNSEFELALHPGSGSEKKNWPEEKWAELLEILIHNTTFNLLLVGGEAEGERLQRLAAALPLARVRVAQSLPLVELGKALERCGGFVGHDSGISHLAAALGLPGLLLWGNTSPAIWRPRSDQMNLLAHAEGLEKLEVTEVFQAINSFTLSNRSGGP
jgi:ADP-heptose:LPS heptosyltransferase